MTQNDCFCPGKILKSFGYKGDVMILIQIGLAQDYEKMESFFVEIDNKLVPFFIESIDSRSEDLMLAHFEDINSPADAQLIIGKNVWLPQELLPANIDDQKALRLLIGFNVIDKEKGNIGQLDGYIHMTHQDVIRVKSGKHEILLPAVAEVITRIDRRKKEIHVTAPEGLIDFYLQ
jgi:16S rRNA processing protein RimM